MAQETVSPNGLHKYSMWLEEDTTFQEYLKKTKTLSSLHHMFQYCQLISYSASQRKDCDLLVTVSLPVPKKTSILVYEDVGVT